MLTSQKQGEEVVELGKGDVEVGKVLEYVEVVRLGVQMMLQMGMA